MEKVRAQRILAVRMWLQLTATLLVDYPEDVFVEGFTLDDMTTQFTLRVHNDDVGKVIGKSGHSARSLRSLLTAMAGAAHLRFSLDITNPIPRPDTVETHFYNSSTEEMTPATPTVDVFA